MDILDRNFMIFTDTKQFNTEPEVVMELFGVLMQFGFTPSTIQLFDMSNPSMLIVKPEFISQKRGMRIAFLPDRIEFNFLPEGKWKEENSELNFRLFSDVLNSICSKYEILSNRLSYIIRYVINEENRAKEYLNEKEKFELDKLSEWSANRVVRDEVTVGSMKEVINVIERVSYNSEGIVIINSKMPTKVNGIVIEHDINTYQNNLNLRFNKANFIDVLRTIRNYETKINK